MKKFTVLTSLLALTACGGGSGGGHSTGSVPFVPGDNATRAAVTDAAAQSNASITSMASEVLVAADGTVITPSLIRPGSVNYNGKVYNSYRLDDIKLFAADTENTENGYLQIGLDGNGRIDRITMNIGEVGAPVLRDGENSRFLGPIFEYVKDGDQAQYRVLNTGQTAEDLAALKAELIAKNKIEDGGHWNMINEVMDVKTLGDDIDGNGTALQYADFGHFNPVYTTKYKEVDNLSDEQMVKARNGESLGRGSSLDKVNEDFDAEMSAEDYQLFAGGYAIKGNKLEDTLDIPTSTDFKGKAIGRVYTSVSVDKDYYKSIDSENYNTLAEAARVARAEAEGYSIDHDIAKAFITTEATLHIDANGEQTLDMPFYTHSADDSNKFYDVKLIVGANGEMQDVIFTGTPTNPDHQYYAAFDEGNVKDASFNSGFYGVNSASEAAGTARLYSEEDLGEHVQREYELQAAYGMTKQ